MYRILSVVFSLIISLAVNAGNAESIFGNEKYAHSSISICVKDIQKGKTIESMNSGVSIVPASVMKLVTTATALELLGPDYRFRTILGYKGEIRNKVLNGDIYIVGGGDPSLGSRRFSSDQTSFLREWVRAVKAAGIDSVNGKIIADPRIFNDEPLSPFWTWEDIGNYYAAGIYGLGAFDNSFLMRLKSGDAGSRPEILSVYPEMPLLKFDNQLVSANNAKDSAYFYGIPYDWHRRILGTMPANRSRFLIRGDIPDPPFYVAYLFRKALNENGIFVKGDPVSLPSEHDSYVKDIEPLCITDSPVLSKIISMILEKSDNLYTEYLLRQIAMVKSDEPASARTGLQEIRDYWQKKGLDVSSLYMVDGCGLSPLNRVSASFLTDLLGYMLTKSEYSAVFKNCLPLAGVNGSVADFLKGTRLEGKIYLKSGSMQGVTCYAGFYERNGHALAVAVMVNYLHLTGNQVRKDIEDFLLAL